MSYEAEVRELFENYKAAEANLLEARAELATLKRQHEQVRADAERVEDSWDTVRDTFDWVAVRALLRAILDTHPAEPVRKPFGISTAWVLNQLAGMRFPEPGGAYDFMERRLKASAESDEEADPVRETFEVQAVRELLVRSEVAAEVLRTRAGFLEQACRALRDSERKP